MTKFYIYDFDDSGNTPLHISVKKGYINFINILLELGANQES